MRRLEHFPNLVAMFFARAEEKGDAPFLWRKADGAWQATTWADAARQVAGPGGVDMPVYQVGTVEGLLSDDQRQQIVTEITRIHCEATDAPPLFGRPRLPVPNAAERG